MTESPNLSARRRRACAQNAFQQLPASTSTTPLMSVQARAGASVIKSIGCASSVGKEPGVDKKNQDMVVVIPALGHADQSLFGVLDGHGQAGARCTGYMRPFLRLGGRRFFCAGVRQASASCAAPCCRIAGLPAR